MRIMGLVETAYDFAVKVLAEGGFFIAKIFQGGTEKKLLDRICVFVFPADDFRRIILSNCLFLCLDGRDVSEVLSAEYNEHEEDTDDDVCSPQDKELVKR